MYDENLRKWNINRSSNTPSLSLQLVLNGKQIKSTCSKQSLWPHVLRHIILPTSIRDYYLYLASFFKLISQFAISDLFYLTTVTPRITSDKKVGLQCVLVILCLVLFHSVGVCFTKLVLVNISLDFSCYTQLDSDLSHSKSFWN